jgi:myo-inositol-1-phosphate synthase
MGGEHTFVSYNVCEDSLLAAGVIIDLIILSELMTRIFYKKNQECEWSQIEGICSFLGYLTKAPQSKGPIINSLSRQRACIENLIRVLIGLPLEDNLLLGYRL